MGNRHLIPYARGRMGHRTLGGGGVADITWIQNAADHAWHDHEEHGHQLQVTAQYAARLDVGQTLPGQTALHNDLPQGLFNYLRSVLHTAPSPAWSLLRLSFRPASGSAVLAIHLPSEPESLGFTGSGLAPSRPGS